MPATPTPAPEGYERSPFNALELAGMAPGQAISEQEAIKLLEEDLAAGWDISAIDQYGGTLLIDAADRGLAEICEYVLGKGVDITVKGEQYGRNALHWAAKSGLFTVVEELVNMGLDADESDKRGFTPLLLALSEAHQAHLLNPKEVDSQGKEVKNSKWVKGVIDGWQGYVNTVLFLLKKGANPNAITTGEDATTPLLFVADKGYPELVHAVLKAGADPNKPGTKAKMVPLHFAARHGLLNITTPLVEAGADLNIQDAYGFTPLHEAVLANELDTVKFLLENGADRSIGVTEGYNPYTNNETPLDIAVDKDFTESIELLKEEVDNA